MDAYSIIGVFDNRKINYVKLVFPGRLLVVYSHSQGRLTWTTDEAKIKDAYEFAEKNREDGVIKKLNIRDAVKESKLEQTIKTIRENKPDEIPNFQAMDSFYTLAEAFELISHAL